LRVQNNLNTTYLNTSLQKYVFNTAIDYKLRKVNAGIAISYSNEQISNIFNNNYFSIFYTQGFKFKNGLLISPALKATYIRLSADYSSLTFYNSLNSQWGGQPFTEATKHNVDFTGSLLTQYKNFYFGVVANHFNQPDVGLTGPLPLPLRVTIHSSYNLHFKSNTAQFGLRFDNQNKFQALSLNANLLLKQNYFVGVDYMTSGTFFSSVGYRHNWFGLYYNFGISTSKLSGTAAYSHLFSATFNVLPKDKRSTILNFEEF